MAKRGMLVAVEGIDGAGKKTQSDALVARATAEGLKTELFNFPRYDSSFFARSISEYLNGRFGGLRATPSEFAALLFAGDRLEGRDTLLAAMKENDLVVSDRYVMSNLAHQSARLDDRSQWDAFQNWIGTIEYEIYKVPRPDLTVYLDVPVTVARDSITERSHRTFTEQTRDLHEEDLNYLAACREAYMSLSESKWSDAWVTVHCLDADGKRRPIDSISRDVWAAVAEQLQMRGHQFRHRMATHKT